MRDLLAGQSKELDRLLEQGRCGPAGLCRLHILHKLAVGLPLLSCPPQTHIESLDADAQEAQGLSVLAASQLLHLLQSHFGRQRWTAFTDPSLSAPWPMTLQEQSKMVRLMGQKWLLKGCLGCLPVCRFISMTCRTKVRRQWGRGIHAR